jgi:hypothetical protein
VFEAYYRWLKKVNDSPIIQQGTSLISSQIGPIPVLSTTLRVPEPLQFPPVPQHVWALPRHRLRVDELKTVQPYLSRGKLNQIGRDKNFDWLRSLTVIIIEQDGVYYVWDGNHRVTALSIIGDKKISCVILKALPAIY